jgi:hypothetical protein
MIEKYTSIKTVLAKIQRDAGVVVDYRWDDIKEWCAEVMQGISSSSTLIRDNISTSITNSRLMIPCNVVRTIAITYNGMRLRYGQDERNLTTNRTYPILPTTSQDENFTDGWISQQYVTITEKFDENGEPISTQVIDNTGSNWAYNDVTTNRIMPYYIIDGGWYKFSFESGIVEIDYLRWNVDEDGFPLIPDSYYLREAMLYYVLHKLVATTNTENSVGIWKGMQAYEYLFNKYEYYFNKAKGSLTFPSYDEINGFVASYVKLIPNLYPTDSYSQNLESRINEGNSTRQGYTNIWRR